VKSIIDVLALTSGVYAGLPNFVVTYSLKPSITSTSLSPTFTCRSNNVILNIDQARVNKVEIFEKNRQVHTKARYIPNAYIIMQYQYYYSNTTLLFIPPIYHPNDCR
jgi:hypothetical protein